MKTVLLDGIPQGIRNGLRLARCIYHSRIGNDKIEKETDRKYYLLNQRHIDWENPQTYTEKLNFSKIYCSNDLKTELTDKIRVRGWVSDKVGEKYLVPIIGIYESFNDIDFQKMPDSFVIKCNHDSGSTTIIDSKTTLSLQDLSRLNDLYDRFFLRRNFGYEMFERQYIGISPKIIVENYLGSDIRDYKFLCFGGKPYYCWVDVERFSKHKRNIYDLDWKLQPFNQMTYGNTDYVIEKPCAFDEMIWVVQKLCEGFDHVRVDLYNCQDKILFGEMTFTNGSGFEVITPHEWDVKLGELWDLDTSKRIR